MKLQHVRACNGVLVKLVDQENLAAEHEQTDNQFEDKRERPNNHCQPRHLHRQPCGAARRRGAPLLARRACFQLLSSLMVCERGVHLGARWPGGTLAG